MHRPRGRWGVGTDDIRRETIGKSCNGRGIRDDVLLLAVLLLVAVLVLVRVVLVSPSVFFIVAASQSLLPVAIALAAADGTDGTNLIHSMQHNKWTAWKKIRDVVG